MGKTWSPGRVLVKFPKGHPQFGLEVLMRRQRVGEILDDVAAGAPLTEAEMAEMSRDEQTRWAVEQAERNIAEFAELLVEWNFALPEVDPDTGKVVDAPVPATVDGVKLLDEETFRAIQDAYKSVTRLVAPPLPQPSDGGEQSEAALTLPQEPL